MGTMAIDGILHFMTQPPLGRQPEIAWRPMPVAVPCQSRKANTGGGNPRTSIASIVPPSPMEIATWTCGASLPDRYSATGPSYPHSVVPVADRLLE